MKTSIGGGFDMIPCKNVDEWDASGVVDIGASLKGGVKVGISYDAWWGSHFFLGMEALATGAAFLEWNYHAAMIGGEPELVGPVTGNLSVGLDVSVLVFSLEVSHSWQTGPLGTIDLPLSSVAGAILAS